MQTCVTRPGFPLHLNGMLGSVSVRGSRRHHLITSLYSVTSAPASTTQANLPCYRLWAQGDILRPISEPWINQVPKFLPLCLEIAAGTVQQADLHTLGTL